MVRGRSKWWANTFEPSRVSVLRRFVRAGAGKEEVYAVTPVSWAGVGVYGTGVGQGGRGGSKGGGQRAEWEIYDIFKPHH